jgi:hypothetical protein
MLPDPLQFVHTLYPHEPLPWWPWTGTGGRHPPETLVAFNRKTWSPWTGARTFVTGDLRGDVAN